MELRESIVTTGVLYERHQSYVRKMKISIQAIFWKYEDEGKKEVAVVREIKDVNDRIFPENYSWIFVLDQLWKCWIVSLSEQAHK